MYNKDMIQYYIIIIHYLSCSDSVKQEMLLVELYDKHELVEIPLLDYETPMNVHFPNT